MINLQEQILKKSPDGIAVISLDGRLQYASERMAAMYGYDEKECDALIGSWIIDFLDPADHDRMTQNIIRLLAENDRDALSRYTAIHKDGHRFEIERHSEIGYRILNASSELSRLSRFVLEHHERWDGSGYPNGIRGTDISEQARILSVAVAYSAMTGERLFRAALGADEALAELERGAGGQFDPDMVRVMKELSMEPEPCETR